MSDSQQRILIYGGTFDPPHLAHVKLPPLVRDRLDCGRILYVPARQNPLKADDPPADDAHRLAMLTIALSDVPEAEICTLELERDGPSYTIDTLKQLHDRYGPNAEFFLMIGADQAISFHKWKSWQQILELAEPVIVLREPWDEQSFEQELTRRYGEAEAQQWTQRIVQVPMIDVSSTDIRQQLAADEPLDGVLDPEVRDYIRRHRLYKQSSPAE